MERNRSGPSKLITPKMHGGVTALAFLGAGFALRPHHLIFGNRALPFFIVPATMAMYEWHEYSTGYINEICRPAHFAALAYGILFGLAFRRLMVTRNI
jgi:hypothetical protein